MGNENTREARRESIMKKIAFMETAMEVCTENGNKRGEVYDFTCPRCGGAAHVGIANYNGHHHAKCEQCGVEFRE